MKRVPLVKFIVICIFILLFSTYLLIFPDLHNDNTNSLDNIIWVLSVVGWVQFFFSVLTWKKTSGSVFSIYTIFLAFSYLFTFGQCLMWALGIHYSGEIGKARLYTLAVPTQSAIAQTQLFTLMGLLAFHTGAVIIFKNNKNANKSEGRIENNSFTNLKRNNLYQVCIIANIISTPLQLYTIARNIVINRVFGYGAALYNSEVVASQNNIVLLLRMMYVPSLFGLLISSVYEKKTMRYCYFSFAVFMLLSLFAGDRGEWLFPLCILMWMQHKYNKSINVRKFLKYTFGVLLLTIVSVAVRNTRSNGVTVSGIMDSIVGESNPIVSAVFELGSSMRPALIINQYGWGSYPYGNSYIHALLGMITERVIKIFQPNYISLSAWFSRYYLKISYGAGFSFIAEALMNYGAYISIIVLLIIGVVFSKFMFSVENIDYVNSPVNAFFGISTAYSMIQGIRNTMLVAGKTWIFSTVLIMMLYFAYSSILRRKGNLA